MAVLAIGACGTSQATESRAAAKTVRVSGTVARICPGPIMAGRPPHCSDQAVFKRAGKRWTVHGHFTVRLAPGVYEVTVDACAATRRLRITHRTSGLKLIPRCPIPL